MNVTSSGTYIVDGTGSCGTATVGGSSVTFYGSPTGYITGPSTLSNGPSATLVANITNYFTSTNGQPYYYQWFKEGTPAPVASGNAASSYTATSPGNYSVVVNKCGNATFNFTLGPNKVPIVNAGSNKIVHLPATSVTLSGSATDDGTIKSYSWSRVSGGTVTIGTPASSSTTISGLGAGTYVFRLTATDNLNASSSDDVTVIVNRLPVADAGPDLTVRTSSVTINGSATDADGTVVSAVWSKISGPAVSMPGSGNAVMTINPIPVGNYVFRLTVTDNNGGQSVDDVSVKVNQLPIAKAGADQVVQYPGGATTLSGSGTDNDGTIQTYTWTKVSGGAVTIINNTPTVVTLSGMVPGAYVFRLTVTDNMGETASDDVLITVNNQPTAKAGVDQVVQLPTNSVTLSGSGSDTDGTVASYAWTKLSGGAATITSSSSAITTVTGLIAGTYEFQLQVKDNNGGSGTDRVIVIANTPPVTNAGSNKIVHLPATSVTLSGSATDDGTIKSYSWSRVSGGTVTIGTPASSSTTISGLGAGTYVFRLTATDNLNASSSDDVTVIVNRLPVADAGPDLTVRTSSVTINGSATDADGTVVSAVWSKISGPAVSMPGSGNAVMTINPIPVGNYVFRLTVTDNNGGQSVDDVSVKVNQLPIAKAGADQVVQYPGGATTLSGSGTDNDGTIQTYTWTKVSGGAVTIINNTPTVVTLSGMVPGAYVFRLTVTDNMGETASDDVLITVNNQPTAKAGVDQVVQLPTNSVTLSGSGSDTDGTVASYAWTKLSGGAATITSSSSAITTVTGLIAGTYEFQLQVKDNNGGSGTDRVFINVYNPINPGSISPTSISVNYNTSPGQISGTVGTGGDESFSYQWETSSDNSNWTQIIGQTGLNYIPAKLTNSVFYRRKVSTGFSSAYTNTSFVNVYPQFLSGSVSPTAVTVIYNESAGPFTATIPTGGKTDDYIYQWQSSIDNLNWKDIQGKTSLQMVSDPIITKTYFRLAQISNGITAYSNVVEASIDVCSSISANLTDFENYVITYTPTEAGISDLNGAEACKTIKEVQYLDGLGRIVENINIAASPSFRDIVQIYEYDIFGRESKKYLPYVDDEVLNGNFKQNASLAQARFYNPVSPVPNVSAKVSLSDFPYSETNYDNSPLNRSVEQGFPGEYGQLSTSTTNRKGYSVKYEYISNNNISFGQSGENLNNSRKVFQYKVNITADGTRSLTYGTVTTYADGTLYVSITKDENWIVSDGRAGTAEEYKDKSGKVILKRTFNKNASIIEMLSTYYVYDDFGNLCFVLPPGVNPDSGTLPSTTALANFCYQYRYDERKRMIERKIPGKQVEYFAYNKLDQLVASQDARLRGSKYWAYTKYDAQGRVIATGWWGDGAVYSQAALQAKIDAVPVLWETRAAQGLGYDNTAWPEGSIDFYSVNYYDDYDVYNLPAETYDYVSYGTNVKSNATKGLLTATLTRSVQNSTNKWIVNYYDEKGRVIQVKKNNHLSGTDRVDNVYNFTDQLVQSQRTHTKAGAITTILTSYTYDHIGRKIDTKVKISTNPEVTISHNEYNELGQLVDKKLHQKSGQSKYLQSVDYRYTIRGWLSSINDPALAVNSLNDDDATTDDDKFGMSLSYENSTIPSYNGNIGKINWKTNKQVQLSFDFRYDKLNRLLQAESSTVAGTKDRNYSEYLDYDRMGNIVTLGRYANISGVRNQIDSLMYSYSGNQLTRVDDISSNTNRTLGFNDNGSMLANEIVYDSNGNLDKDMNKGISDIHYSVLNTIDAITFSNGDKIEYEYDRLGAKLKKKVTIGGVVTSITDYIDGIQYDTPQGGTAALSFIQTEEGRARWNGTAYIYEYDLKDHLGNTRVTIQPTADDATESTATVVQENGYYPFGADMPNLNYTLGVKNRYLYNGKELQEEKGLNWYDYGARFYDPVIGRFTTVDPLAEMYQHWSPYNYTTNNPFCNIDPDGRSPQSLTSRYIDPNGNTILNTNDGRDDVFMVPWNRINEFKENAEVSGQEYTDRIGWNNVWRSQFKKVATEAQLNEIGYNGLHSEEAKDISVKMFVTKDYGLLDDLSYAELKAQWNDPVLVVGSLLAFAHAGVGVAEDIATPKYASRVRARGVEDPKSHNFPYSFDKAILSTKPRVTSSGYKIYTLEGIMNDKQGVFEIGVNKNGVIDHRFFRPSK
ncbi:PKD domain-containing protein [Rubrolithibacter danxiaensis]|uniref:PKD domain-containing protein n=1 Tax=Rubrolithibacter danxiaensis TaxID=3390805 RepID=UPI003BF804E9